jgi:GT2 family glycosyltransferase
MAKPPSIAIVILNWNGVALLKEFLPSVIQHSQFPNTTIYVADNASTDESVAFLKENYASVVTLIQNTGNFGYAKGYNVAVASLTEDYFILLNSDVKVSKNWLNPLIELMERDNEVGACQPKLLSYRNKQEFEYAGACGGFLDKYGYPFCRGRIFDSFETDNGQYDDEVNIFWASGAALMVRSSVFKTLHGFEEDFFAHMEEIDLCWRIHRLGYQIKVCPTSVVYHLGGGTLSKMNPRKTYLNFRNNRLMLTKNIASNQFITNLLLRNVLDVLAGIQAILYGKFSESGAIFKALLDFHLFLPKWIKKRRALQQTLPVLGKQTVLLYPKSIVVQYFIRKINTYKNLP